MSNSLMRSNENIDLPDQWLEPENHQQVLRLLEIQKMKSHIPKKCPDCGELLIIDEEQIYCPKCGLVTQDSYNYQAGQHFTLPHGLKLM